MRNTEDDHKFWCRRWYSPAHRAPHCLCFCPKCQDENDTCICPECPCDDGDA